MSRLCSWHQDSRLSARCRLVSTQIGCVDIRPAVVTGLAADSESQGGILSITTVGTHSPDVSFFEETLTIVGAVTVKAVSRAVILLEQDFVTVGGALHSAGVATLDQGEVGIVLTSGKTIIGGYFRGDFGSFWATRGFFFLLERGQRPEIVLFLVDCPFGNNEKLFVNFF